MKAILRQPKILSGTYIFCPRLGTKKTHMITCTLFLPIFTAATDEKYFNSETLTFYTLKIYSKNMLPKFRTSRNLCGVLLSMPGLGLFFSADFFSVTFVHSTLYVCSFEVFYTFLWILADKMSLWPEFTLFLFKTYEAFLTSKTFDKIQSKNCLDKIMFFVQFLTFDLL